MLKLFRVFIVLIVAVKLEPVSSQKASPSKSLRHPHHCKELHENCREDKDLCCNGLFCQPRPFGLRPICAKLDNTCYDHSDCASGLFCNNDNRCGPCSECHFCHDGVNGNCGTCDPTIEKGHCKEPCEDTSKRCAMFAPEYCQKNLRVRATCKKSCGLCGSTCNFGIRDQYQVIFHNYAKFSVDIFWINYSGKEILMKSKLAPGAKTKFDTNFKDQWIFKSSSSKDRLLANANEITDDYFEGCHFKAKPNERIIVKLSNACNAHSDCSRGMLCYDVDYFGGVCFPCDECHYCKDGIDSTCGSCGRGYPTREEGPCLKKRRCKTIAGPSKNKDCVFPFLHNGRKYNKCASDSDGFWCSTKVDSTGSHISGNWGICGSDCPKGLIPKGSDSKIHDQN